MERLRALWASGVGGKLLISLGGLGIFVVVCCTGLLVITAIFRPAANTATTGSTAVAQIDTAAPASTAVPALTNAPTPIPEPTNTPPPSMTPALPTAPQPTSVSAALPTATVSPEARYLAIAQEGAIFVARLGFPDGEWKAVPQNLGDGPEVQIIFPLSVGGSNEQTVRLGKAQAAGIIYRLFTADSALVAVVATGTLPDGPNNDEQGAIAIRVTRVAFDRWDGKAETLEDWNVSQRLR